MVRDIVQVNSKLQSVIDLKKEAENHGQSKTALIDRLSDLICVTWIPFLGVHNIEQWRKDASLWTRVSLVIISLA